MDFRFGGLGVALELCAKLSVRSHLLENNFCPVYMYRYVYTCIKLLCPRLAMLYTFEAFSSDTRV